MQSLPAVLKAEFYIILAELKHNFELDEYFSLFYRLKEQCQNGYFEEIAAFLQDCLDQEIFIAHGLLFMLYRCFGYQEKSKFHYDEIIRFFPEKDIWEDWLKTNIWLEFENSSPGN